MFKIMTRPSLLCISISEKDKIMLPLVFNGWIEMSNHRNADNVCCRFDNKRRIGPFQQKVVHWLYCNIPQNCNNSQNWHLFIRFIKLNICQNKKVHFGTCSIQCT
jgi:hypothetical protein